MLKTFKVEISEELNTQLNTLSQTMCISEEDLVANYLFQGINRDLNILSTCWTLHMTEEDLNEYA